MINKRDYTIALILFILSFLLRFLLISKGPYSSDCLGFSFQVEKTLQSGQLQYIYGTGYPFTVIMGSIFFYFTKLLGNTDPVLAINFMSVFFGSLCIPLFYFLVKKLFNVGTAILSAISLSLSPIFLSISTYGMSHTLSLFCLLAGLLSLISLSKEPPIKRIVLSVIFIGFLGATRAQELVLLFIPITFAFFYPFSLNSLNRKELLREINLYFLFVFLITFTALLLHIPFFIGPQSQAYFQQLNHYQESSFVGAFGSFFVKYIIKNTNYLFFNYTILGILTICSGAILLFRSQRQLLFFIFLWVCSPLLFYSLISSTAPRFLTIILPPLCILIGYTLDHFSQRSKTQRIISLLLFMTILILPQTIVLPNLIKRHNNAYLPDYARWIKQVTPKNSLIIVYEEGIFIQHYGQRKILGKPTTHINFEEKELLAFRNSLYQYLDQGIPIYISTASLYNYDPKKQFLDMMLKNFEFKQLGERPLEFWHRDPVKPLRFYAQLYEITKS